MTFLIDATNGTNPHPIPGIKNTQTPNTLVMDSSKAFTLVYSGVNDIRFLQHGGWLNRMFSHVKFGIWKLNVWEWWFGKKSFVFIPGHAHPIIGFY